MALSRAPKQDQPATAVITLNWQADHKRWRADVRYWTGAHWAGYNRIIENTGAMDQLAASRLLDAVKREMESWLF